MSTALGIIGVPQSRFKVSVNVSVAVVTATFSVISPDIIAYANISTSSCVSTYSINNSNIKSDSNVIVSECTANYSINPPVIKSNAIVIFDICTSIYSINTPTIYIATVVHPDVCLALYNCNSPIVPLPTIIVIQNANIAAYSIPSVTVHIPAIFSVSESTAAYSINNVSVIVEKYVNVDSCIAAYSVINPEIHANCTILINLCISNYSINSTNINAKSITNSTVCSSQYSINNPNLILGIIVYPTPCVAVYSIPTSIIQPDECIANYLIPDVTVYLLLTVHPTVCTANYSVISPILFNETIVSPASSMLEFYVSPYYKISSGGIPNYRDISKMPTLWLRKCNGHDYENERKLYRKLVTEAYNKFGVCMTYYIVSYDTQYDRIWGEDNDRRFIRRFDIMCYFPLQTEEKMWTKFAIEGIDNFSIFSSKNHFRTASTYGHTLVAGNIGRNTYPIYVPKDGDIIQSKYNKYLYEITNVKEESMMMHLSKTYTWEFVIKPFMDEHLSFDSATSASMSNIHSFVDTNDILGINSDVQSAFSAIEYAPKSCERDSGAGSGGLPFNGW